MREPLIEIRNLSKSFPVGKKRLLKAVDDVSFAIYPGETLGLVGESGCGKTTCSRTLLRLYEPSAGSILFKNQDVVRLKGRKLLEFKKSAQMIFQDPYASLDPRMTIAEIVGEGMQVHFVMTERQRQARVTELLAKVGLTEDYANRFPHELSGGQRQRVGIARALAVDPEFIVCDEPISALDVSIQAQIVNLLLRLQKENGLTYLFISHDLSMVKHISDRVGIMYLGSLVELGPSADIFKSPLHPYTQALLAAIPTADPDLEHARQHARLEGEVPSPIDPPSGCKFRTRCTFADACCAAETPALHEVAPGYFIACHHWSAVKMVIDNKVR
ncbi:MAG: ATP-binding cassette domain-containing protein [Eubacteriales bacterium]|jgi:oligopeptide transport system ATP-binding protein|nr:ATP-binding cassette domain-containing protein [Eubacteriales bacterium]